MAGGRGGGPRGPRGGDGGAAPPPALRRGRHPRPRTRSRARQLRDHRRRVLVAGAGRPSKRTLPDRGACWCSPRRWPPPRWAWPWSSPGPPGTRSTWRATGNRRARSTSRSPAPSCGATAVWPHWRSEAGAFAAWLASGGLEVAPCVVDDAGLLVAIVGSGPRCRRRRRMTGVSGGQVAAHAEGRPPAAAAPRGARPRRNHVTWSMGTWRCWPMMSCPPARVSTT